ncbi:MAG: aminotransferase class V-fold PLP-dependent enzyme [Candidatus Diapherotrites archaeon]|nr:aminotransferase class V-fold PLP-dependent enzyme [Candidatus Diapherotrites archaeon]
MPILVEQHQQVTLVDGKRTRIVRLNNAATTPPFQTTLEAVNAFLQTYGALHRGAGPNANQTYETVSDAIQEIRTFVGASRNHELLFTQNTSDAINLFARLLKLKKTDVVLTTDIEHTSNNLPWRYNTPAHVVTVRSGDDGSLDYADLEQKAQKHAKHLRVLAFTGASNQTGYIPDIKRIALLAHRYKALLFIDAAQLAPHRPIDIKKMGIDALAFSAHKIYAPFGIGVLALPKRLLDTEPVNPGGGSIDMISDQRIVWAPPRTRHQTGTWNVTGIVALAKSCETIRKTGWRSIVSHEKELVRYAAKKLSTVPGITMYVSPEKYVSENRIGTFPFNLAGYHHALISAILDHEYGIETRAGTICNHRLVREWFSVSDTEQRKIENEIRKGNRLASYGIVRASLGIQNTKKDVDALVEALTEIALYGPRLRYRANKKEETFEPIRKTRRTGR